MPNYDDLIADLETRLDRAREAKVAAITPFPVTVKMAAYRKDIREALATVDRRHMAGAEAFDATALIDVEAQLTVDPTTGSYTLESVTDGEQTLLPAAGLDADMIAVLRALLAASSGATIASDFPELTEKVAAVRERVNATA